MSFYRFGPEERRGETGNGSPGACHVLVVGSLNMDLVVRCDRMPSPGETVSGNDFRTTPGGKGANQAVAASRLGGRTHLVGSVGKDAFGQQLLEALASDAVDVSNVANCDNISTGIAVIQVDAAGENAITVAAGANGLLRPGQVEKAVELFEKADALLLQLEIPLDTVEKAVLLAKSAGALTVLDPAPAPVKGLPAPLWEVDFLTPNQSEAAVLSGVAVNDVGSARRAAGVLRGKGIRNVIVKMGSAGALYVGEQGEYYAPAFPANVVDTTAAGDAFSAALAVGLAEAMPIEEAIRFACAAGALAVTKPGAQKAMPFREEVERLATIRST